MENNNQDSFWQFSDQLRLQAPSFSNLSLNDSIWGSSFTNKRPEVRKNFDIRVGGEKKNGSSSILPSEVNGFNNGWKIENSIGGGLGVQKNMNINGGFNKGVYSKPGINQINSNLYNTGKKEKEIDYEGKFGKKYANNSNQNKSNQNKNSLDKRFKTLPASEALPRSEIVGGYIFVCNNDTMQENLKRQLFGALTWPVESVKPVVVCEENFVVTLTTAESSLDFEKLVASHCKESNLFSPLVPQILPTESSPAKVPVMALQVTLFPNTGIFIGISTLHVVGDGRAISNFMKSWASVCKSELEDKSHFQPEPLPVHDRSWITDPDNEESLHLQFLPMLNITQECFYKLKMPEVDNGNVRATFLFDGVQIQNLREFVFSQFDELYKKEMITGPPPLYLSSFVLTCACLWRCMVKTLASEDDKREMDYLVFPVDNRELLDPPLPSTYFGNCLVQCIVEVKKCDIIGEDRITIAAVAIANAIKRIKDGQVLNGQDAFGRCFRQPIHENVKLPLPSSPTFRIFWKKI